MLDSYHAKVEERAKIGVVPKPLTVDEVAEVVTLLQNPPAGSEEELVSLLENRIPPGVDEAAKVKAKDSLFAPHIGFADGEFTFTTA